MDKTFDGKLCNEVGSRDPRQLGPLCFGCVDVLVVATHHCIFVVVVPFLLSFLPLWLDVCAPWVWTLGKES